MKKDTPTIIKDNAPKKASRIYILPETGEVVEAFDAQDAVVQAKKIKKGKK